ncbi:MAG: serine hydrolase domain-containing protein [Candidatus Sulfotelmatobacter sp.]|jgi:CubicO group peptidase (beta-lactamase class C family)
MNPFRFASVALALVMWSVSGQAQNGCKPTDPAGSFAGTAISQQAGKLDVTLNLHCDNGRYAGGAVSSVGTYTVQDGHFDANQLYLTLESSGDTVTIEAAFDAGILRGKFTAAGDTGPIELHLPGPQAAETKPAIEHVTADTPRVTSAGATFKVPSGWSIETRNDLVILTPPETDTHVCIFDSQAADAKAAVAEAWAAYKPESKRPIKLVTPRPAREGWEERQVFDYETSPNERAAVQALALRAGNRWTVVILEGTDPTVEKRSAPIGLVFESLRPKDYKRESFAGRTPHPLDAAHIDQLKSFVETSMQQLGIPGVSIALIDGGKIVYEGGFGVRELGKPEKVDENTVFMAASNTKGMTTLLLAELVDEKKLKWDEPVIDVYPAFKLGDADTTKKVLVKNLICACTGVPRQDLEWLFEFKNATPETELALLGTMQPTSKFGEVFQYSNLMAAAAGYIGAHLVYPNLELGAAYDKAMQQKIFDPLGMRSTTFDYARALAGNHASPHGDDIDGKPTVASMAINYSIVPARPAGAVWTSSADLIRYVQDELTQGKLPSGQRLVSAENLLMRRAPQISLGEDAFYGMGLIVDRTYGVPVVSHGGSMSGFKSNLYFLPDSGIGAVLLTNSDNGGMLLGPFGRRLLEVVFDGKPEAVADVASRAATHKAALAKDRERLVVPAAPALVSGLAKHYSSKELGDLAVLTDNGVTTFDLGEWKSTVASRKNDDGTTSFITVDPGTDGFEFVVGDRAGKRVLIIRDGQHEYVFDETA